MKEIVNPRVAERKQWAKFGLSAKDGAGPATDTTVVDAFPPMEFQDTDFVNSPLERTSYSDQAQTGEKTRRKRKLRLEA